jgi:two-component system, OmpR family, response regulator VicR
MITKITLFYDNQPPKQLIETLSMNHYQVQALEAKEEHLHLVEASDVVVLYDLEALKFLTDLKENHRFDQLPIVVVSRSQHMEQHIKALQAGADDYIYISEHIQVVLARIERLLSRYRMISKKHTGRILFKHLEMDLKSFEVKLDGEVAPITHKEYELLRLFVSNPGKTLSKESIYKVIWRHAEMYSENVINVHIRHLRKKIEKNPSFPEIITTVWGFGYKLGDGELKHI